MSGRPKGLLPSAIYIDANPLIAARGNLLVPPMGQLVSMCRELGIAIYVPEVAKEEWIGHFLRDAKEWLVEAEKLSSVFGVRLVQIEGEDIGRWEDELCKLLGTHLSEAGVEVIPTPAMDIRRAVAAALNCRPPFGSKGDAGFKDFVIVQTVLVHASEHFHGGKVVFVTADQDFNRKEIVEDFQDLGVAFQITVAEKPEKAIPEALRLVQEGQDEAMWARLKQMGKDVLCAIKPHEDEILRHVAERGKVGMMTLRGFWSALAGDKEKEDLKYATIDSVDAFRPKGVSVTLPMFDTKKTPGRARFSFSVTVEFDLTITRTNLFDELRVPLGEVDRLPREQYLVPA